MSECTVGGLYCVLRDEPAYVGEVHLTALDLPIHDVCAKTTAGAAVEFIHALRALGCALAEPFRRALDRWAR